MLPLKQSNAARGLADCLSDFLPGSGARQWRGHITFGSVAKRVGVGEFWPEVGSKAPRLAQLFERTLEHRRERFEPLIIAIVQEGLLYRRKAGRPIAPDEIVRINGLILDIGFRFPDLWDESFHDALASNDDERAKNNVSQARRDDEIRITEAQSQRKELDRILTELGELHALRNRQEAGLRLEGLLNRLFTICGLKPREPFRVVGEQIDGSFELDNEVYLVEAKWEREPLPEAPLLVFRGKVEGKSTFTRGIFIALNGVSADAVDAITRGKQPNFFAANGHDLMMVLQGAIGLPDFLRRRRRLLGEKGMVVASFDEVLKCP